MTVTTLADALQFAGVPERIKDPARERFVTLKVRGGGAVRRVIKDGKTPVPFTGYRLTHGQFIYSRIDARNGAFAIVPPELDGAVVSKDFPVFRIRADRVDPGYLLQYLRAGRLEGQIRASSFGATNRQRIAEDVLLGFEIPLPPLPEQRRIAAILDHADAIRTRRRQVVAHLDALIQSIFHDMFGGSIDRLPFAETCKRVTVGVVIKPASHYVDFGVPALRTLNVKPGRIELDDLVYFSKKSSEGPLAKSRLRSGDLVIARTGKPGTTAIVPPELDGANAIDLIVATPDTTAAHPTYLEALLNSSVGKRIVSGEARGQVQQHFNIGSLKAALVPVPALGLQRRFADLAHQIRQQRAAEQRTLATDDELFASLQSRAFRGEL